jgi:stage III sporulation protein AG
MYVIILLFIGISFMMISPLVKEKTNKSSSLAPVFNEVQPVKENVSSSSSTQSLENRYEQQLTEALSQIEGVGTVTVFVNLEGTVEYVYEKNNKTNEQITGESQDTSHTKKSEERSIDEELVFQGGSGSESPIIQSTSKPKIRGVLVVVKGAEKMEVKRRVTEAVTRMLDVPSHRVAVLPKK